MGSPSSRIAPTIGSRGSRSGPEPEIQKFVRVAVGDYIASGMAEENVALHAQLRRRGDGDFLALERRSEGNGEGGQRPGSEHRIPTDGRLNWNCRGVRASMARLPDRAPRGSRDGPFPKMAGRSPGATSQSARRKSPKIAGWLAVVGACAAFIFGAGHPLIAGSNAKLSWIRQHEGAVMCRRCGWNRSPVRRRTCARTGKPSPGRLRFREPAGQFRRDPGYFPADFLRLFPSSLERANAT